MLCPQLQQIITGSLQMASRSFVVEWRDLVLSNRCPLRPIERLTACALAKHMDSNGGSCFPSQDTLAEECNCDARSVRRALDALEQHGWITRHQPDQRTGKGWRRTHYQATLPPHGEDTRSAPMNAMVRTHDPHKTQHGADPHAISCGSSCNLVRAEDPTSKIKELDQRSSTPPRTPPTKKNDPPVGAIDFEAHAHWRSLAERLSKEEGMQPEQAQAFILETAARTNPGRLAVAWATIQTNSAKLKGSSVRAFLEQLGNAE